MRIRYTSRLIASLTLFATFLVASPTWSQQKEGTRSRVRSSQKNDDSTLKEKPYLVVYKIQHASSESARKVLHDLLEPRSEKFTISVDMRSGSLIVSGNKNVHDLVIKVLETVDVVPNLKNKRETIKVFSLQNRNTVDVAKLLGELFLMENGSTGDVRIASDENANSIIVSGDLESLEMIESLLLRLDGARAAEVKKSTESSDKNVQFEVFWVADARELKTTKAKGSKIPKTISDFVKTKLSKEIDISDPVLISQARVQGYIGEKACKISAQQIPTIFGPGKTMEVSAAISHAPKESFSVDLKMYTGKGGENISTSIRTKPNHPICFAITQTLTGEVAIDSIFIVQITEK